MNLEESNKSFNYTSLQLCTSQNFITIGCLIVIVRNTDRQTHRRNADVEVKTKISLCLVNNIMFKVYNLKEITYCGRQKRLERSQNNNSCMNKKIPQWHCKSLWIMDENKWINLFCLLKITFPSHKFTEDSASKKKQVFFCFNYCFHLIFKSKSNLTSLFIVSFVYRPWN